MKLGLLVIGDGRRHLLDQSVRAVRDHLLHPVTARLMINDEAADDYCTSLDAAYPDWMILHTRRQGMAAAVLAGFALAASHDLDAVLWIEEDMEVTRALPITDAWSVLDRDPTLAQMCFPRASCDPEDGGDVYTTTLRLATKHVIHPAYEAHDTLFTLQPCLIPARTLGITTPCPPGTGIETHLTNLTSGSLYAWWGHPHDAPYATHIGYGDRSHGYQW